MKSKVLLILGVILVAVSVVSAQKARKTITNFDLEKYRIQREKAEADYRENYAKRGMPSPEELQRREQENALQRENLSRRLAAERQQNEQNQLRVQIAEQNAEINYLNGLNQNLFNQSNNQSVYGGYPVYGNGVILNNGYYNRPNWNRPNYPVRGVYQQNRPSVVVGGGMVYTVPRSSAAPPQRIGRPRGNRRF